MIVCVKAGANVSVQMIRDLRGVIERERAEIGVFLMLTERTRPMVAEEAAAGQFDESRASRRCRASRSSASRRRCRLRDRAVQLPARRDDTFKRAAREEAPERQGKLGL